MEEIIGRWSDTRQLAIDILLRSFSPVPTRLRTPTGIQESQVRDLEDSDVDDAWEDRAYRLVDGEGKEIVFPIKLISDTTVTPQ